MDNNLVGDLNRRFLNFYKSKGYETEVSNSIIPEDKSSGVLFTICGGIKYDKVFRGLKKADINKVARIQRCLRTDNNYRIGVSNRHLSSFDMVESFNFGTSDFPGFLRNALDYLKSEGVNPYNLFINMPSGNQTISKMTRQVVKETPININELPEKELMWAITNSESFGSRIEIGSQSAGYELWNVSLVKTKNGYCIDSGMASERLVAVQNGLESLFEIPELSILTGDVMEHFDLEIEDARYVADQVRSIGRALEEKVYPSAKGKGNKVRMMLKNVLVRVRDFGDPEKICNYFPENSRNALASEICKTELRYHKLENLFRLYLRKMNTSIFELDEHLNSIKLGRKHHDRPKLLNEEYIRIACIEGFDVPVIDELDENTLGKRYGLPLTLVRRLKSA